MTHLFLHALRELEAQFHEPAHNPEDVAMTEKAVAEAGVQKVSVCPQHIINSGCQAERLLKGTPVWFQHLHGHVVLQALYKVEHALQEGKGWDVPTRR